MNINDKRTLDIDADRSAYYGKFWLYTKEQVGLQMPKIPSVFPFIHYVGNKIAYIKVYTSFGDFVIYNMKYFYESDDRHYYAGFAPDASSELGKAFVETVIASLKASIVDEHLNLSKLSSLLTGELVIAGEHYKLCVTTTTNIPMSNVEYKNR